MPRDGVKKERHLSSMHVYEQEEVIHVVISCTCTRTRTQLYTPTHVDTVPSHLEWSNSELVTCDDCYMSLLLKHQSWQREVLS